MSDHDNFEDRLRAFAEQLNRSVQRFSEIDIDDLAERYGVDAQQARAFADTAGQWLNDHLGADPLFSRPGPGAAPRPAEPDLGDRLAGEATARPGSPAEAPAGGPHPLDAPTEAQGRALAALDSGRWTVRAGSNALAGTRVGSEPVDGDLVGELRARDWIAVDGTLTLVGRHALTRWCRAGEDAQASD